VNPEPISEREALERERKELSEALVRYETELLTTRDAQRQHIIAWHSEQAKMRLAEVERQLRTTLGTIEEATLASNARRSLEHERAGLLAKQAHFRVELDGLPRNRSAQRGLVLWNIREIETQLIAVERGLKALNSKV